MKPQSYLTKEGVKIFGELVDHCEKIKLHDADSFELSMLANAFDLHCRASLIMNKQGGGYAQKLKSEYSQITADFTVWKQTGEYINKNAGKFGLDPASREKLKSFTEEKPKEKKGKLKRLA